MTREEVYKLIDGERDYQDDRWWDEVRHGRRSVDEFVLYVQGYAADAVAIASHTNDRDGALAAVRKIAALCVACMEQHGAPARETPPK